MKGFDLYTDGNTVVEVVSSKDGVVKIRHHGGMCEYMKVVDFEKQYKFLY